MDNKIEKMQNLIDILNRASEAYYGGKAEILSDDEWNNIFDELTLLENETGIILENSPTQNISHENMTGNKEKHEYPALSLPKSKNPNDLLKYAGNRPIWMSWKLDGLTLVITYDNGKLTKAMTRGDGTIGTNITDIIPAINGIPNEIEEKGHLVVRGEAVISYTNFNEYKLLSGESYANPRNLASGSLNLKDIEEIKKRHIQFIPFTLVHTDANIPKNYEAYMNFLTSLGFQVVEHKLLNENNYNNITELINEFTKKVENKEYDIPVDGLVITYDDIEYARSGVNTGHHSTTGGFAFKWGDKPVEAVLDHIEWSCGVKSITPVAVFNPVEIEGTTVSRASLCNISECQRLGIGGRGSKLNVIKANMIIPKITKVLEKQGKFEIPCNCPICQAPTIIKTSEMLKTNILECSDPNCPAKQLNKRAKFVSKHGLNIKGMSIATLSFITQQGWLNNYADIYNLKQYRDEWANSIGYGSKSVDKLLKAINDSRKVTFSSFLYACCIPGIGIEQSKLIAEYLKNIDDDNNLFRRFVNKIKNFYDFTEINGIGPVINQMLYDSWVAKDIFENNPNSPLYKLVNELEFIDDIKPKEAGENKCQGLTFVITGDVKHYKNRDELKSYIEEQGGKVVGSVSKKTNYLINNDITSNSSKNIKAKELDIPIISEDDFIELMQN